MSSILDIDLNMKYHIRKYEVVIIEDDLKARNTCFLTSLKLHTNEIMKDQDNFIRIEKASKNLGINLTNISARW